jgi:hypothetical protein
MFANITFDASNIEKFVTEVRASLVKMEDVGVKIPKDILTYDLLRRLPSNLDNIKQKITHSKDGEDITPNSLIDHLKIHINELKVSSANKGHTVGATMFTKEDPCCKTGAHNPFSLSHTKENCWMIHPKKRTAFYEKSNGSNVSSFSTFISSHPNFFVLDSGSTSHMVSDRNLFASLDKNKKGLINTSCGPNTLKIKGKGTIRLQINQKLVIFHNVLLVTCITVNLLSLQHLLLEQCTINFSVSHFTVLKNNEPFLKGNSNLSKSLWRGAKRLARGTWI